VASQGNGIVIQGLNEFRAAVRIAAAAYPREIPLALKKAGIPVVAQASALAPRLSGALAGGYKVSVRGTTASVVSSVPYAGGAEWGRFGKFSGFNRYGAPPRFAGRAVDQQETVIQLIVENELREIVSAYGWFH
jgi:hypothetical protein